MINIKSKFRFTVSPYFETFFALQTFTDENSRIHNGWKQQALHRLPVSFHKKVSLLGGSSYLWPVVADTLLDSPLTLGFEDVISRIASLPSDQLQKTIFLGTFHEEGPIGNLLSGRLDLFQTITRISKAKREWLAFIGLYPPKKTEPLFRGLEFLLRTPKEFQRILVDLLEMFWESEFKQTWGMLSRKLEQSMEEKERLFHSCSLEEFARLALLRVEIDERRGLLKAVRGGYTLPLKKLSAATILPSGFNDKRHWTSYEDKPAGVIAYFPYFDPAISLTWSLGASQTQNAEPERDAALIFKALGDTTRYAMVTLLAKGPETSANLAKTLGLSRPTISHHIRILREAGLLEEKLQGNALLLSLRREVLETLSELAIQKLFHSTDEIDLKKTRTK